MLIVADTHVHLYNHYDLDAAIKAAFSNLNHLAEEHRKGVVGSEALVKVLCLTEREDCHFFQALKRGDLKLSEAEFQIHQHGEQVLIVSRRTGNVESETGDSLFIFSGRQIVTAERLEVLALLTNVEIGDGLPLDDVVSNVVAAGGVPVIPWSPGKWWFRRGWVVRRALKKWGPQQVLVGDSTLRPSGWRDARIAKRALKKGFRIAAGTDPLPLAGEEKIIGTYGLIGEADFNWRYPVESIRSFLFAAAGSAPSRIGARREWRTVWARLRELKRPRKGALNKVDANVAVQAPAVG